MCLKPIHYDETFEAHAHVAQWDKNVANALITILRLHTDLQLHAYSHQYGFEIYLNIESSDFSKGM